MTELLTLENLPALLTLTALEVVLGIDNVIVIAIIVGKLPQEQRKRARQLGLLLAMVMRIGLLLTLSWFMLLTEPLFTLGRGFSGRDIIMILGGLFLLAKATHEIHDKLEEPDPSHEVSAVRTMRGAIIQIVLLDIIFSIDSVITAVGMTNHIATMVAAIIIAVAVMLFFSGTISAFIDKHPTLKMLALSFVLLIGVMLIADGFGKHIDRAYIYFAMSFSLGVEVLNILSHRKARAAKVGVGS